MLHGKRQDKRSNTQGPTQQVVQQTVEAGVNCKKKCGAGDTKPNTTTGLDGLNCVAAPEA